MRKAEARVVGLLDRIAHGMGIHDNRLTLKLLCQSVEESYSLQIMACRTRLMELVAHVGIANQRNHQMIIHSLGLIKESMSVLKGLLFPDRVYFSTGKFQEKGSGGKICSYDV